MKLRELLQQNFCVYKITNLVNGKIYIGKTSNMNERWDKHLEIARTMEERAYQFLHKSINKYGQEKFKIEIIEDCLTEEISFEREKFWIKQLRSNDPNVGMNLTNGGEGASGLKWSEESRDKIRGTNNHNFGQNLSQMMKENNPNLFSGSNNGFYGKHHSLELIEFLKNREISSDTKESISIGCRGEGQWNSKFTDDDILEIRKKWDNKECSQAELARQYGVKRNTINQIVNRKRWTHI